MLRDTLQAARSLAHTYPNAPLFLLGSASGAAVVAHAAARDGASTQPVVRGAPPARRPSPSPLPHSHQRRARTGVVLHRAPVALSCTGAFFSPGAVPRALRCVARSLLPNAPLPKWAAKVDTCREVVRRVLSLSLSLRPITGPAAACRLTRCPPPGAQLPPSVAADGLCTREETVPVAAADELHRLLAALPRALPLIRAPALVIDGGRNECVVAVPPPRLPRQGRQRRSPRNSPR